jgi:pimeloyl-ACP methyl ester carboxylesterase
MNLLSSSIATNRSCKPAANPDRCVNRSTRPRQKLLLTACAFAVASCITSSPYANAQSETAPRATAPMVAGPIKSDLFKTTYIKLTNADEAMLFEPNTLGAKARVAVLFTHPIGNNFDQPMGRELAKRGYRVLAINHHMTNRRSPGEVWDQVKNLPGISRGIDYLRTLSGVQKVVILGHSGGGELIAFYADVALNGPSACQGPEKIYPCRGDDLAGLSKPDGVILLDSTPGSFNRLQSLDPAVKDDSPIRDPALDMLSPANGFDPAAKRANYPPDFVKRFYDGQAARATSITKHAEERLKAIEQKESLYSDDEVMLIRGAKDGVGGARLYNPDPALLGRTREPHVLLKADGTKPEVIIQSLRPPAISYTKELGTLENNAIAITVREYLATSAMRFAPNYNITADDIVGVDWRSAAESTPGNAEGITVPSLIMVMSCHYMIVPGEITFRHLAAKDKTFAAVEGAVHTFTPCKPEYGDTVKRLFDYVDGWVDKPGRF